jgi:NAD(P)-dependent dehydrogenase (short-subunit alcohol dehydrogenase family)
MGASDQTSWRTRPCEWIRSVQINSAQSILSRTLLLTISMRQIFNGILEGLYSLFHHLLVRSAREDHEILNEIVSKYKSNNSIVKTAIVTGANSGIGKEVAKALIDAGWFVVLACRSIETGQNVIKDICSNSKGASCRCISLDIGSYQSIQCFVKEFQLLNRPLHLLIHNAGVYYENFTPIHPDCDLESQFVVNHLGPYVLTQELEPYMPEYSRIIQVGSVAQYNVKEIHTTAMNDPKIFNMHGGYSLSKALISISSVYFSRKFSSKPIHVVTVHPGGVATNIFRRSPWLNFLVNNIAVKLGLALDSKQGALTLIWVALAISDASISDYNGSYVSDMRKRPLPLSFDSRYNLDFLVEKMEEMTRAALEREHGWVKC